MTTVIRAILDAFRRGRVGIRTCGLFIGLAMVVTAARADEIQHSVNDLGGTGLLNMPSARMQPDGQINVGASFINPYRRYFITWQILPWAELTFRYTDFRGIRVEPAPAIEGSSSEFFKEFVGEANLNSILDRGFDARVRLLKETRYLPDVTVGIQDFVGTGLFAGEYIAASKQWSDFDFTVGLGWGYFASRATFDNPFGVISDSFKDRSGFSGFGGESNFGDLFHGESIGLFGGVEYYTPIRNLTLKAEYNAADPAKEQRRLVLDEDLPIGIGANYRLWDLLDLGVGWERGNALMLRASITGNMHSEGIPNFLDPRPPEVTPRPAGSAAWRADAGPSFDASVDLAFDVLGAKGFIVDAVDLNGSELVIRGAFSGPGADRPDSRSLAADIAADVSLVMPAGVRRTTLIDRGGAVLASHAQYTQPALPGLQGVGDASRLSDTDRTQIADRVFAALREAGFASESLAVDRQRAVIRVGSLVYRKNIDNVDWIARILANNLPPSVEELTIVLVNRGVETDRVTLYRGALEDEGRVSERLLHAERRRGGPAEAVVAAIPVKDQRSYPRFDWYLRPTVRQHVGSRDSLYLADVNLTLSASVDLAPGLRIKGTAGKFLFGNLDRITARGTSRLPQVRTLLRRYLQEGRDHISNLQVDYIREVFPRVYARASAGLFEWMYGGAGGEVLYWPERSPVAIGLNAYWVKQRDFDQYFDFRAYDTVTGHASIYYKTPFYNTLAQVHVGRYLAKDKGITFDLSRQFDGGFTVGFFATFTNVSARDFGEGSFDKGFYIRFPLETLLPRSSRRNLIFAFRPLTRDGGQFVGVGPSLYGLVDAGSIHDRPTEWRPY